MGKDVHELSIARAIVGLARKRIGPDGRATRIAVRIGALTGLVPECLSFYVDGLTRKTPLEGVHLEVEIVPARLRCPGCGDVYEPPDFARVCTHCGSLGGELLQGDELELVEVEAHGVSNVRV